MERRELFKDYIIEEFRLSNHNLIDAEVLVTLIKAPNESVYEVEFEVLMKDDIQIDGYVGEFEKRELALAVAEQMILDELKKYKRS